MILTAATCVVIVFIMLGVGMLKSRVYHFPQVSVIYLIKYYDFSPKIIVTRNIMNKILVHLFLVLKAHPILTFNILTF